MFPGYHFAHNSVKTLCPTLVSKWRLTQMGLWVFFVQPVSSYYKVWGSLRSCFLVPPLLCSLDSPFSPSQTRCFGLKLQQRGKHRGRRTALRRKVSQAEPQRIQGPHPSLWDVRYKEKAVILYYICISQMKSCRLLSPVQISLCQLVSRESTIMSVPCWSCLHTVLQSGCWLRVQKQWLLALSFC